MKKLIFLLFLLIPSTALAAYNTTYNPFIRNFDYVGVGASSDVTIVCDSGQIIKTTGSGTWACAADASGGTTPTGTSFTHINAGSQDAAARAVNLISTDVTAPTGVGFAHVNAGALDGASRAVNLASADVIGTLAATNGGTGVASGFNHGYLPIGNSTGFTMASIVSGNNTIVSNLSGSITISADITAVSTLTDGANIAVDSALANVFTVTLGGNRTLSNPTNGVNKKKIIVIVSQDGVGSRTLAYGNMYRFGSDVASPTLSTGAGKHDYLGFIYNSDGSGTSWDCVAVAKGY